MIAAQPLALRAMAGRTISRVNPAIRCDIVAATGEAASVRRDIDVTTGPMPRRDSGKQRERNSMLRRDRASRGEDGSTNVAWAFNRAVSSPAEL
ncbi:hypothetical protein QFZ99_000112 [Paraburkholderia atlantica]